MGRSVRTAAGASALLTVALVLVAGLLPSSGEAGDELQGLTEAQARSPQRWVPPQGVGWQLQLQGELDLSVDVPVYEVDGFDTSAETVARLHEDGRRVVCYISAGSWEDWRPDAASYPESVLGRSNGWPGERWLDVRRLDVLRPLLSARLDLCRAKGFDAVDPDNVDGFTNDTGFPLTAADQLRFNTWLARAAHRRGLSIGLKNDLDQVRRLSRVFDFAVNEQCLQYDECQALEPFLRRGKAVLHVEYELPLSSICSQVPPGFSSLRKHEDLTAWRQSCR